MPDALLPRLESAVEKVLAQNRHLEQQCCQLQGEKSAWLQEKKELLAEVEQVLERLDSLKLEDT